MPRTTVLQAEGDSEPRPYVLVTAYDLAERFIGLKEVPGATSNPQILAMLRLDQTWPEGDEVAWCSAFANYVAFLPDLPRTKSLRARSWLRVGRAVTLDEARKGFDVVVLQRGDGVQPGPEVIEAPGHVGFFDRIEAGRVWILAGNQGNAVSVQGFPIARLLGIRRLLG